MKSDEFWNPYDTNMPQSDQRTVSIPRTVVYITVIILVILLLLLIAIPLLFHFLHQCPNADKNENSTVVHVPHLRLPRAIYPVKYWLSLKTYLPSSAVQYTADLNFTFNGTVIILVKCSKRTQNLTLNAHLIKVNHSTFEMVEVNSDGTDGRKIELREKDGIKKYTKVQQIAFIFKENLIEGKKYKAKMTFKGRLSEGLTGFYRSSYVENGETKWLAVTQFQPTSARRAFPCFDEPDLKAEFMITVTHPKNMVALSNTKEKGTRELKDGWAVTDYITSPKMSTYLVAMAVCEFSYKESYTKTRGTLFRVWAKPSMSHLTTFASEVGPKLLEYFERYFQIPFPLEKQDMIAIPDFDAGAMENWGLITYREFFLLYSNQSTSAKIKLETIKVIAHELVHQWFGNLVTMEWWNDLWLNEGFATYLQSLGTPYATTPSLRAEKISQMKSVQSALDDDQYSSTHPLQVTVTDPTDIIQIFDRITYDKLKSANKGWDGKPLNVSKFMHCWVTRDGFPMVTVTRDYKEKTVTFTQEKLLLGESTTPTKYPVSEECKPGWYVPVWYQIKGNPTLQFDWLKPTALSLVNKLNSSSSDWLLANPEIMAFCRVRYDEQNYQLLINQLKGDYSVINPETRAQLIDDVFALSNAGKVNYSTALDLSQYLIREIEFLPWYTSIIKFNKIDDKLKTHPDYYKFQKYYSSLIEPIYFRMRDEPPTSDPNEVADQMLREMAWKQACRLGVFACVQGAKDIFASFKRNCKDQKASSGCNTISADLREVAYCMGTKHGNEEDWEFLWEKYKMEDLTIEHNALLLGLGCSKKENILKRLLNEAYKGSTIKSSEAGVLFGKVVSKNRAARKLYFDYVTKNWDGIKKKFDGSSSFTMIVQGIGEVVTTKEDLKKFIDDIMQVVLSLRCKVLFAFGVFSHLAAYMWLLFILQAFIPGLPLLGVLFQPHSPPFHRLT